MNVRQTGPAGSGAAATSPAPSSEFRFVVHGPITSNNAGKAPVLRENKDGELVARMSKSRQARDDAKRVREIARVCVVSQGWAIPEAVKATVIAWNSRLDADNAFKTAFDSLKGLAWQDDADVLNLSIDREWDDEGERYEFVVHAVPERRPWRLSEKRAKKPSAPAWRSGDPIPDGWADLGGKLVTIEHALGLIRKGERNGR